jgi:hypothetical protein
MFHNRPDPHLDPKKMWISFLPTQRIRLTCTRTNMLVPGYKFAGVLYVEAAACQHVFVSGRFRPPTHRQQEVHQHGDGGTVLSELTQNISTFQL